MNCVPINAFSDNYIWALPSLEANTFICVDPGQAEPVLRFAQQHKYSLEAILITHHHADHIGGLNELLHHYPKCVVYGPADERIPFISHTVYENQHVAINGFLFQVLYTPGHTSTHISYFELQQHWLFCGDTLFSAGCGRVFDGTIEQLYQSLEQFKLLPLTTKIFCAHEYTLNNLLFAHTVEPKNQLITKELKQLQKNKHFCSLPTTLEKELLINPFLRTNSKESAIYAQNHNIISSKEIDIFRLVREQKDKF